MAPLAFVNFETPPVSPMALSPDGTTLLVANLADARLEIFSLASGTPVWVDSVFTGIDPVSVRFRGNAEAWVVNHVSDSVSIVDLPTRRVRATLDTRDEPCDVVFAGAPLRAFVSCSQATTVQVFDPADLTAAPVSVAIDAEDPRALAVSPDGPRVYAAVFESGNRTTVLGGGIAAGTASGFFPPNVVSDPATPYGGVNPPPNASPFFDPPIAPLLPPAPAVRLIVRKDAAGAWRDDTGANWTPFVSGASASASGRPVGWDLPDHDVAVIDTATLGVTYVPQAHEHLHGARRGRVTGDVYVVGTDATNEKRFEPAISGRFLRVHLAARQPPPPAAPTIVDLNPHLTYRRERRPGGARAVDRRPARDRGGRARAASTSRAWARTTSSCSTRPARARARRRPIAVGRGPDGARARRGRAGGSTRWNRFAGTISVVTTATDRGGPRIAFYDPDAAARSATGRKHLYDTHTNSGLGPRRVRLVPRRRAAWTGSGGTSATPPAR